MNKIIPVLVAVIICFSVGVMASYFQVDAIQTWYPFLNKPSLTPPNFIFPSNPQLSSSASFLRLNVLSSLN